MVIDYTVVTVLAGVAMLGALAGALGVFVVLSGQSLLGDAIAHAALPGIACAFLLTQSKNAVILLAGGAVSGALGMMLVSLVTSNTRLKKDTAQGMVLSIFFGLGLVLLTVIQKQPIAHQAVLNKFLFGNVSTLLHDELRVIAFVSGIIFLGMLVSWKELVACVFDRAYAHAMGLGSRRIAVLLASMLLLTIVIGLQVVGVVLMSSMLIAPAAAARQWTSYVAYMVMLAACFGACSGVLGVLISARMPGMPTGPVIVVVASCFVFFSLLGAPQRGLCGAR